MDAPEISTPLKGLAALRAQNALTPTQRNHALNASFGARGMTQERLAALAGTSRPQVCLTLRNTPGRGHRTRPKLIPWLTPGELVLLRWAPDEKTAAQMQNVLARKNACQKDLADGAGDRELVENAKKFPVECSISITVPIN